jgi:hypothetical protein
MYGLVVPDLHLLSQAPEKRQRRPSQFLDVPLPRNTLPMFLRKGGINLPDVPACVVGGSPFPAPAADATPPALLPLAWVVVRRAIELQPP